MVNTQSRGFTTAYDEYALRAFKVNSVDYLLEPVEKEELQHALVMAEESQQKDQTLSIQSLLSQINKKGRHQAHSQLL